MLQFDVIMPVHAGVRLSHLKAAVESISKQIISPKEFIVSIDGPVTNEINDYLTVCENSKKIRLLRCHEQRGPGKARDEAIKISNSEWIALMDSDDVSKPTRFKKQIEFIEKTHADVVGGNIEEFFKNPGDRKFQRVMPEKHEKIKRLVKWRQPVNHVTLMMKRDIYLAVGGYNHIYHVEDYDLIVRLLASGARFANQTETLVDVRCGENFSSKRHGMDYFRSEYAVIKQINKLGLSSVPVSCICILTRLSIRMLPLKLIKVVYRIIRFVRV
jgi:glycosyltransferase involved in cell wall biosynthesis